MRAVYAFSGDPITNGHLDIVQRAASTYPAVTVAIGENPEKITKYLFATPERVALARQCLAHLPNVTCTAFSGLLGEYAYRQGFDVIVRGLRNSADLVGELDLFAVIKSLHHTLDMVFFPTRPELSHISSSVVKAMVAEGGDVSAYCPVRVKEALERKMLGKFYIGIAGGIAAGKSFVAQRLLRVIAQRMTVTCVSLDEIGHQILGPLNTDIARSTRARVAQRFGRDVVRPDGTIDRRLLGRLVFSDPRELEALNEIMREPMMNVLYDEVRKVPAGMVLLEGAILVEASWSKAVNNNVILVDAPVDLRLQRLMERSGISADEARAKIARQLPAAERKNLLAKRIKDQGWGRIWEVMERGDQQDLAAIDALAESLIRLAAEPPVPAAG